MLFINISHMTGSFLPFSRAEFWPDSQSKIATFFPNTMSVFPQLRKVKITFFFFFFFRDHYYLYLSGMLGIIQSKIK